MEDLDDPDTTAEATTVMVDDLKDPITVETEVMEAMEENLVQCFSTGGPRPSGGPQRPFSGPRPSGGPQRPFSGPPKLSCFV